MPMPSLAEIILYGSMPFTSAIVGWITNIIALKMTFLPLEFVGLPPYLGWQGIIPSKARKMADKAVDLITSRLLGVDEIFARLDPERVADEMAPVVDKMLEDVIEEAMNEQSPAAWSALPQVFKDKLYERARVDSRKVIVQTVLDLRGNVSEIFDLKHMVIEELMRDKALINEIFLQSGEQEFRFIERSGLYFGFAFGVVLMLVWYFYHGGWILPTAGFLVGYLTNWLALKLIFEPVAVKKIGPWRWQGLFLKRQPEVSARLAALIASQIVNSSNILHAIFNGPHSAKIEAIIEGNVKNAFEEFAGSKRKILAVLVGGTKSYRGVKQHIASSVVAHSHVPIRYAADYAEEVFNVEHLLREKLEALPPDEFVDILHPIFQEDEWKLILAGGVLGLLVGVAQYIFLFS